MSFFHLLETHHKKQYLEYQNLKSYDYVTRDAYKFQTWVGLNINNFKTCVIWASWVRAVELLDGQRTGNLENYPWSTHWRVKWTIWRQYVKLEWWGSQCMNSLYYNLLVGTKEWNIEVFGALWTLESYKLKFPSRTKLYSEKKLLEVDSKLSWASPQQQKKGAKEKEVPNKKEDGEGYRVNRSQDIQDLFFFVF